MPFVTTTDHLGYDRRYQTICHRKYYFQLLQLSVGGESGRTDTCTKDDDGDRTICRIPMSPTRRTVVLETMRLANTSSSALTSKVIDPSLAPSVISFGIESDVEKCGVIVAALITNSGRHNILVSAQTIIIEC